MEMIIFLSAISMIFSIIMMYLFNRQKKLTSKLKVGDKITIDGFEGEILEKKSENSFVVKIEVPGMVLSKR
jgi:hypothetical protein